METLSIIVKARIRLGYLPNNGEIAEILLPINPDTVRKRIKKLVELGFLEQKTQGEAFSLNDDCFVTTKESAKFLLFFIAIKQGNDFVDINDLIQRSIQDNIFSRSVGTNDIRKIIKKLINIRYLKKHEIISNQIIGDKLLDNHLAYLNLIVD